MTSASQWVSRTSLATSSQDNCVAFGDDPAESLVPLSLAELDALRSLSSKTWSQAGIKASDRVLVSTSQHGAFPLACSPEALAPLCSAVSHASPRGRLRLLSTVKNFRPTVWITTPCAALDFLARLYMEFNVDPFELGIEHIVLLGEIASPGCQKRLADEFESTVTEVYTDPLFGAALALRAKGVMQSVEPGLLALAAPGEDRILSEDWAAEQDAEIVLTLDAVAALKGQVLRTGQVVSPGESLNIFHHTVGDRVLARGRWLSLPLIARALKLIDGMQAWQLLVERGEGTLDRVTLKIGLNRESLVGNPMWDARMREAISSVTPLRINIESYFLSADEPQPEGLVDDQRDHHLGAGGGLKPGGGWEL